MSKCGAEGARVSPIDWAGPFRALRPGQRYRSRPRVLSEAELERFALAPCGRRAGAGVAAAGPDPSPAHCPGSAIARAVGFVSFAVPLLPLDPARVRCVRGIHDIVCERAPAGGEAMHVEGLIAAVREIGRHAGLVGWSVRVLDAQERRVCGFGLDVVWSDPTPAGSLYHSLEIDYPAGVLPC